MQKKILIVDDEIFMIQLLKYNLNKRGYEVYSALNGLEAWQKLKSDRIDLVITDLDMPQMDGYELCKKIHTNKKLKNVPIIIVTCKTQSIHKEKTLECGIREYIVKPFNAQTLKEKLDVFFK